MKTNLFQLSLLFLLCTSVLCGCANDDEQILSTDGSTLTVHATANGFASADGVNTRASENDYATTFTVGDQIGVFAVKDGRAIEDCKNVPLTYNGSGWEGNAVYYYTGAEYFAYYPYDASMRDKTSVEEIVDAFTPQSDQSTNVNYTKSDLMTADGVSPSSDKTLNFQFEHKMSLIEISLPVQKYITPDPDKYEYSSPVIGATFSIASGSGQQSITPYKMGGGVYRYIVRAGVSHTVGGEFQTGDGKTIEYSKPGLSLVAGNYKRLNVSYDGAPSGEPQERAIAIGDYYYSDGNICPGDASNPPSENCIGIVFSTDVTRIGRAATEALKAKGVTPHGLVMALTNASNRCKWGEYEKDENADGADGAPFKDNTVNLKKQYHNVDGYAETHWIINTYKNDGSKLKDTYSAFYYASLYGKAEGGSAKYAVPTHTTGWFIPSMGQWWDILSNLGKVDLDSYKNSEKSSTEIYDYATTAADNMNSYLNKITDAETFRDTSFYFWSSSESDDREACRVSFSDGSLYLSRFYKHNANSYNNYKVRCVLAF